MRKLKKVLIVILMLVLVFVGYVEIVNRNSKGMTYRQKVLKAIYPLWMWWGKIKGKTMKLSGHKPPVVSFYSLRSELIDGTTLDFATLRGKKVLLVNTASDCGYTNQYEDLQKLYDQHFANLVVIGFPANDFKEQEKGNDEEIAKFCKLNYGVTFPLMKKSTVVRSSAQHPVFQWLTDSTKNGWNNKPPAWNFSKYLVDENGTLTNYFAPMVSPMSEDVLKAVKE